MNEQFTVGKVLGTSFKVWGKNIIPFFLITALVYLPLIVWGVVLVQGDLTFHRLQLIIQWAQWAAGLVFLLNIMAGAAITFGVVKELQGERASFGACIGTGLARFFPTLGVALLVILCDVLGFVAVIIPGLIINCMLFVATQASVIERPGITGALGRSRTLTDGHRWQIFGLTVLLFVILAITNQLEQALIIPDLSHTSPDVILHRLPTLLYVDLFRNVLFGSLMAVVSAVTYYYLRAEKDGTSATELAQVFA